MLDLLRPCLHIGLSPQNVTVLHTSGWRRATTVVADDTLAAGVEVNLALLQEALSRALNKLKTAHAMTTIVLADRWVRFFSVIPPQNPTRLDDCKAAAAMRFQALYGESSADWTMRGDWKCREAFLVCAIPSSLENMLQQIGSAHKLSTVNVVPYFIAAWNRHRRAIASGQWFGVVHEQRLTLGAVSGNRLAAVRIAQLPDGAFSADWFSKHVTREALRLDLSAPESVQLCGEVPAAWLTLQGPLTCRKISSAMGSILPVPSMTCGIELAGAGWR